MELYLKYMHGEFILCWASILHTYIKVPIGSHKQNVVIIIIIIIIIIVCQMSSMFRVNVLWNWNKKSASIRYWKSK